MNANNSINKALATSLICLGAGIVIMALAPLLFLIYGPVFLAAFVLSIIAIAQSKVLGGVVAMLGTLILPVIFAIVLAVSSTKSFKEGFERAAHPERFAAQKAAREKERAEHAEKAIAEHKVLIGMSREEAEAAWGKPKDIDKSTTSMGRTEYWHYSSGSMLSFENGVLDYIKN